MTIQRDDFVRIVVERVAVAHPALAYFSYSEILDWPSQAFSQLRSAGLLLASAKASTIICPGCEWQCHKPPVIRLDTARRRRCYISCDEEPRHGRIQVPVKYLDQYQSSLRILSNCFGRLTGHEKVRSLPSGDAYELGLVKGRNGPRMLGLSAKPQQIDVVVGEQREPLLTLLFLSQSGLSVDGRAINRLANRKVSTGKGKRVSDRNQQQSRKRKTQQRHVAIHRKAKQHFQGGMNWSEAARSIEGTELAQGLSFQRLRRIISERNNFERNSQPVE